MTSGLPFNARGAVAIETLPPCDDVDRDGASRLFAEPHELDAANVNLFIGDRKNKRQFGPHAACAG